VPGGEDQLVTCEQCDYRANVQIADGEGKHVSFEDTPIAQVATPEKRTVEEVTQFLNVTPQNLVKSIFFTAAGMDPILVLIRGDYDINEEKIRRIFGSSYSPASAEDIQSTFKAQPGFIGPAGMDSLNIYADDLLRDTKGMITGANRDGFHIKGVNLSRDVKVSKYHNFRKVKAGDRCSKCGGELHIENALELGHIFKLGTKYSISLGANFLDEKGNSKPIIMGSYGIGLERIMACACEQKGDDRGAVWPISIAPFDIHITILNPHEEIVKKTSEEVIQLLTKQGFSVIIDDRDISAGVKFNDADLIGIPIRITVGPKGIKNNQLDIHVRETGEVFTASQTELATKCTEIKELLYRRING
jgi:prolyl-tRNA synthetase